jgi:DNA-binding NarL/FixJ family response regulator
MIVNLLFAKRDRTADTLAALTPAEGRVLALLAEGLSNTGIGAKLVMTTRAVERHINSIFKKLDLPERDDVNRRVLAALTYAGHRNVQTEDPATAPPERSGGDTVRP